MSVHLVRSVENIKKKVLSLSTLVEENVHHAVRSVEALDRALAMKVIESDKVIDDAEIDVEEDALKILALYQPVAGDLRFIVSVLKLNNDLERIGDLAVNIAKRTLNLVALAPVENRGFDFHAMSDYARDMLRKSLDSLISLDSRLAFDVCAADDKLDIMNKELQKNIKATIVEHPQGIDSLVNYLAISRYLERIGDHATNIAEDVIYMVQGRIVRHHLGD